MRPRRPAVRARHQQLVPSLLLRDDGDGSKTTVTSLSTEVETTTDKSGSTTLSTRVVTSKIISTITSSSSTTSSSTTSSSSSSSASSSSSSNLSSSASSRSSSSSASSRSSASTASITSASALQASTSSPPGSSSTSTPLTFASSTGSSTATGNTATSSTQSLSSSSGSKILSTGAIVGICVGGGAVVIVLLIFIIRKRFLHRREKRVNDWLVESNSGPDTGTAEKTGTGASIVSSTAITPDPPPSAVSRNASINTTTRSIPTGPADAPMPPMRLYAPPQPQNPYGNPSPRTAAQQLHPASVAQPPSMMYNSGSMAPYGNSNPPVPYGNPVRIPPPAVAPYANYAAPSAAPSAPPAAPSSLVYPASLTPARSPENSVSFALVRNAFLPGMPDELAVNAGEMVRVLAEYDDGWALCANLRGEQGVVPQECLQRQRANPQASMRSRDERIAFMGDTSSSDRRMTRQYGAPSAPGASGMRYQ
ncbi:uncharacterized protein LAESUDRAFT_706381 [Laetiporus sulphureus 93-53]|uniref:SH3 domain-containing protein n=1 Tax=Laetiporus sulphureus 93-53 TaxID=1314785 RepID=A0A165C7S8_9APHY|nr:uncharacterized protein LAESUDRAFT_706381 [Laetiporus sulphureus 93-53]KZT02348.1 hypothetical protein LAESUDRAFT_706381 [Laetiporus sulphureus 93-53]